MERDDIGIVAAGAAFVVAAWLPWYESHDTPRVSLRGWDLGVVAVVAILLAAYAAGRVVFLRFKPLGPDVPLSPAAEPFAAAFVALLLTAYRVLDVPEGAQARTGWLTLAGVLVVVQVAFATHKVLKTGFRASPS